jgi:RHS repeat-associated protein
MDGQLTATRYPTFCEEYTLDLRGNRTAVTRILPGENGEPDRRETTHTGYDAKGQAISTTDPLGRTTQTAFDALGRIHIITNATGGTTKYVYDTRDNLRSVADANDRPHTFTYDLMNRAKTEARPLGDPIVLGYDEVGNLINRTSPGGELRSFVYDDANRLTDETQFTVGSQTASQTISFTYDGRNLMTGYSQIGDTESSALYVYDAKGQKTDETVTYGSGLSAITKTLHYGYEANGLKKRLNYPDGTIQATTYDKNRLASIGIKGRTIHYTNYQWRVPTLIEMPGATRAVSYDPLQRPTRIKSESLVATLLDYEYQYDVGGNITRRTTEDGEYLYGYDALGRLTEAAPPLGLQQGPGNPDGLPLEQYTYDGVHNRQTSAHQPGPWVYNENNELQSYGVDVNQETYEYDANGNTRLQKTGDPTNPSRTREFLYNAAERLSEIKDNDATIAKYQYDPMGRRFKKEVNGTVTWFQYADEGLIAEFAQNGTLTRTYGWKPGGMWGTDPVWLADSSGSEWRVGFFHSDVVGSPQIISSEFGEIMWSQESTAFGVRRAHEVSLNNPLGMAGQYEDVETGDSYNFNRIYVSVLGRYSSADPIGLLAGTNVYSYAAQSPIGRIDPLGLCDIKGTFSPFPFPDGLPSFETCPDGVSTCFKPDILHVGVHVRATGTIAWGISCVKSCCPDGECCPPAEEWTLDGDANYELDLDVPIPIPSSACKWLGRRDLVVACYVGRTAAHVVQVYKYSKAVLDERLPPLLRLIERMVDPSLWCKLYGKDGRHHLENILK